MVRRAPIVSLLVAGAALATLAVSGCERKISPDRCQERFSRHGPEFAPDPSRRWSIRYVFDASKMDPRIMNRGIEGVLPSHRADLGGEMQQAVDVEIKRLMAADAKAEAILMSGSQPWLGYVSRKQSWLLYAPSRSFSFDEVGAHLAKMCRLGGRGLRLRQTHIISDGRSR